jgi:uncharacterized repeat protein (TIGR01451 family)
MKKTTILYWSIPALTVLFVMLHYPLHSSEAATSTSIAGDIEFNTEQVGPSWYDPLWNYRRPVILSNSGGPLDNYQVLVKLDNTNFDFDKANDKGWDVRFTKSDGISLIDYWIESWNKTSQSAYIWVEIPTLANGDTTIYLYYSNSEASNDSDGSATFNFFDDDWSQFAGAGCIPPECKWYIRNGIPKVYSGELELTNSTGISTINLYQYKAVGYKAKYYLDNFSMHGYEWGGFINGVDGPRTMIRDLYSPFDFNNLFLQNRVDSDNNNLLDGNAWHNSYHIYEIRWRQGESIGDIDDGTSIIASSDSSEVPTDYLPVTFYSFLNSNDALWVDWVYVREYRSPEPTVAIGMEQGAVDLKVNQLDSPDPLYAGEEITYLLTISNTSSIDSMGVILTDTLPGKFSFVSAIPSQGSCSSVVCNLGTIRAHRDASITVNAETTIDGVFTNTAVVNSLSYDLNISNNSSQETTTVLSSADLAINLRGDPEAVRPESILTYIITVTNQGPSPAEMVNIVNNLPVGVEYQYSSPNICSLNVSTVTCSLATPMAPSTKAQIRIIGKVKSTTTQNLDFTAAVSSGLTYDPIPANNTCQEQTLLDADKPVVNWVSPIQDEDTYITNGGWITLEASARDNDPIGLVVKFKLWDHLLKPADWVIIGTTTSSPFRVEFNSDRLVSGELYQMYVYATDRAGNESRQRILIMRQYKIFLPLTRK